MIAVIVNTVLVLIGSFIGLVFKNKINTKYTDRIFVGLALCVTLIGIDSALSSNDTLCVIISMVVGILLGEALGIEDRLDSLGEKLKKRFTKNGSGGRFTEAFMTSTLLFCIGSMAIMGSIEAGMNHNYDIIFSKSVIDGISAITFAAAMGVGVCFSSLGILVYQGLITLLAIWVGPLLPEAVMAEMSGVGGLLIIALSINMLGMTKEKLKVGNMLPAIFVPIAYVPFANWISNLISRLF